MSDNELSPEGLLAARVLDVLSTLSARSLADLRRPDGPRNNQMAQISRYRLAELVQAFEVAYPGVLDDFVRRLKEVESKHG